MLLTVLIATAGRAEALRQTLESVLTPANLCEPDWEVLVIVNSASDARSLQVCAEFEGRYSERFRFLIEPCRGKARALNLGLGQARGQILAMTDDDVICAPNYISAVMEVCRQYPADVIQGRVLMDWIGGRPEWLSQKQAVELSEWDFGDKVIPYPHGLSGCNMVVRADVARRVGGFAIELGPGASGLNEDTEFSERVRRAGYQQIYAPQILVRHQMPRSRTTPRMLRRRSFIRGRSAAYYEPGPERVFRISQWHGRQCLRKELHALWLALRGQRTEALRIQCESREIIGFYWQHCRFRIGPDRTLTYPFAVPAEQGIEHNTEESDSRAPVAGKVEEHC